MNKITLIIPDLHHRVNQATKIINAVGADQVICLGDVFDDFDDTPEMVEQSCDWLNWFVNKPNHIMCWGNHDVHYGYSYRSLQCSGYDQWKYFIIHDLVPRATWDKLKWFHFLDNRWLISHGGLHKFNVPDSIAALSNDRAKFFEALNIYLEDSIIDGFKAIANNVPHWALNAGRSRGGMNRVGGLTWCDFEREFFPVKGLNQIVGHTPQGGGFPKWCRLGEDGKVFYSPYDKFKPTIENLDNTSLSTNIDLDVHGNTHYGIWDGKKLTVGNYRDL